MVMKSWFLRIFFGLVVLCVLAVAGMGSMALNLYHAAGPLNEDKITFIERGQSVQSIASLLYQDNIISSPLLFRVAAKLTDQETKLQAGEYLFPVGISMDRVLTTLSEGQIYYRQFTIPEGLTSWQVVQRLNAMTELEGKIETIPAEGSLLPETYNFSKGDTKAKKIKRMEEDMINTLNTLWEKRQPDLPIKNKKEALILASIVEKETSVAGERQKVAGVFINRLKIGMPLQTDPTVIYALTKGEIQDDGLGPLGRRLLRKDLKYDSPYNTYVYPGLPPGPIANPGRASIEAVLNPDTHNYLYFVADGTGGHAFAKTLKGHNQNVAKWRKIRKSTD